MLLSNTQGLAALDMIFSPTSLEHLGSLTNPIQLMAHNASIRRSLQAAQRLLEPVQNQLTMHFVKKRTELRKLASATILSESVRSDTLSADPFSIDLWSDSDKVTLTSLARQTRVDGTLLPSSKKALPYPSAGERAKRQVTTTRHRPSNSPPIPLGGLGHPSPTNNFRGARRGSYSDGAHFYHPQSRAGPSYNGPSFSRGQHANFRGSSRGPSRRGSGPTTSLSVGARLSHIGDQ